MEKNVGHPLDKAVRFVLGFGLLSLIFILQGDIRWIGLTGVFLMLTAGLGWCPCWTLLGIDTYGNNIAARRLS